MFRTLDVESLDLLNLAAYLQQTFGSHPAVGELVGRTQIRDAVLEYLDCSLLEAEEVVDTMIAYGLLVLRRAEPGQPGAWLIRFDAV